MASQSIIYKVATIVQTISIAAGILLMLATVIGQQLTPNEPPAISGLLVGLCFFFIAASSVVKTFSQR